MPEAPIASRITFKTCMANADVGLATTLNLETSKGARLMLSSQDSDGTYAVWEKFNAAEDWVPAHDDAGNPVTIDLSNTYGTPLPSHLFAAGWIRFVGPTAEILAKVFG